MSEDKQHPAPQPNLRGDDMRKHYSQTIIDQMGETKTPVVMKHLDEEETADGRCREADGCPTEKAVLQRFWRKHHAPSPSPKRETFDIPEVHEAVRDADGRATGETKPIAPPSTNAQGTD